MAPRTHRLLVQLVAPNLGQVVPLGVEVEVLDQVATGLDRCRLARTQVAVDVHERLVLRGDRVLLHGQLHRLVLPEPLRDLLGGQTQRLQQNRHRLLALTVDLDVDDVLLVDLEFDPRAAAGDDLRGRCPCPAPCRWSSRSRHPGTHGWDTTTRSVPFTMNVPLLVMSGKSPMNTVCDLISPVSELKNSAVTNSGCE